MNAQSSQAPSSSLPALAVRLGAAWLATGALFKLFAGSPKLLPPLVVDLSPFDLDLTFRLVIAVELALVVVAILRPRAAWLPLALLFAFFEVVLVSQALAGAESCGCLGDTVKMPPAMMMAIDGVLLLGILGTRPWRAWAGTPLFTTGTLGACAALGALVFAAPWLVIAGATSATTPTPNGAAAPQARYQVWEPATWVGKLVYDIPELSNHIPAEALPTDGLIVLWRASCDHCKDHLAKLRSEDKGAQPILLLQLQDDLKSTAVVETFPEGAHVTRFQTPAGVDIVVQTPWDVMVAGGVVTAAVEQR